MSIPRRLTRTQYLASAFPFVPPRIPTAKTRRPTRPAVPLRQWVFLVPNEPPRTLAARTLSQAKALLKKALRVKRLPDGTEVYEQGASNGQAP